MLKIILLLIFITTNAIASYNKNDAIDFTLASLDGSRFIKASQFKGKQTLLIFFDTACPPCLQKLSYINKNISQFEDKNIVIINLINDLDVKNQIRSFNLDKKIIFLQAPSNPEKFLRRFGNLSGALPYLVLLDKNLRFCTSKINLPSQEDYLNCANPN